MSQVSESSSAYLTQVEIDLNNYFEGHKEARRHYHEGNLAAAAYHSQRNKINYASTDNNGGLRCYAFDKMADYLNQEHVRQALNVPEFVQEWAMCNDINYTVQFNTAEQDMSNVYADIFKSDYVKNLEGPFRIMLYNGDADLVCHHKEAEYFVEKLKKEPGLGGKVSAVNEGSIYVQKFITFTIFILGNRIPQALARHSS